MEILKGEQISPEIKWRREWVFLLLCGIFLGTLAMLNILGISRFIDLSSYIGISPDADFRMVVAVGVLPYPITFLATDLISEIFGHRRASMVVWIGLLLNMWVLFILWLGGVLDAPDNLSASGELALSIENGQPVAPHGYAFYEMRRYAFGAIMASMLAYLAAQFVDVQVFHWLKKKTKGKKLWLRNNLSTMTSQLVDTTAVILITHYYAKALPIDPVKSLIPQLLMFILAGYLFKFLCALIDTVPFYFFTKKLKTYLRIQDENFEETGV